MLDSMRIYILKKGLIQLREEGLTKLKNHLDSGAKVELSGLIYSNKEGCG